MTLPERVQRCQTMLGITPVGNSIRGNSIKLSTVLDKIKEHLPENATQLECVHRARCVILFLCGGTLFSDTSNNYVSLIFLNHLEDLTQCGQLSWGSAVLAYLYRGLCKATAIGAKDLVGAVQLLQIWAWTRFRDIAPRVLNELDFSDAVTVPYGARYIFNSV
jgi:hypothetical protein